MERGPGLSCLNTRTGTHVRGTVLVRFCEEHHEAEMAKLLGCNLMHGKRQRDFLLGLSWCQPSLPIKFTGGTAGTFVMT